jgi:hypothetical protein
MIDRIKCIDHCCKEVDKYKCFLENHGNDRKYADLIPAWEENAEIYGSIIAYLKEGNI